MWHSLYGFHSHANTAWCCVQVLLISQTPHAWKSSRGIRWMLNELPELRKEVGVSQCFWKLVPGLVLGPVSWFLEYPLIIQWGLLWIVDTFFETCVSRSQGSLKCRAFYVRRSCSTLCTLSLTDVVSLYHSLISAIFVTVTPWKYVVNKWHFILYAAS